MQLGTVCEKRVTSGSFEVKISIDIQQTWYFVFCHVFLKSEKKRKIRILEHCQKLESLTYIFAADGMDLSSFKLVQWAP